MKVQATFDQGSCCMMCLRPSNGKHARHQMSETKRNVGAHGAYGVGWNGSEAGRVTL